MSMKIACRSGGIKVPNYNLTFEQADQPIEVEDKVGEELLKSDMFYKFGKKKVIKEENYEDSSFSKFTITEVENE